MVRPWGLFQRYVILQQKIFVLNNCGLGFLLKTQAVTTGGWVLNSFEVVSAVEIRKLNFLTIDRTKTNLQHHQCST
jgi:hypothetical protein